MRFYFESGMPDGTLHSGFSLAEAAWRFEEVRKVCGGLCIVSPKELAKLDLDKSRDPFDSIMLFGEMYRATRDREGLHWCETELPPVIDIGCPQAVVLTEYGILSMAIWSPEEIHLYFEVDQTVFDPTRNLVHQMLVEILGPELIGLKVDHRAMWPRYDLIPAPAELSS